MSRYEADDRFDFTRLLDWKKAQVVQGDATGLQPDETYTLQWTVPYGAQEQAREWIYANRQGFQGPEIPFMQLSGFWRTVSVRYQTVEAKVSNAGVNILHTIAKGYYTSLDWDAARILAGERASSNTSNAGVDNSQSAPIQETIQVRIPFIAPEAVEAIVATTEIPNPLVVRGNTFGDLKLIVSSAQLEEDGSYSVLFRLANPQYTLSSYADFGTPREQFVCYLWNVPKDYSQKIIDDWKALYPKSSSATIDYNESVKYVNIVLRRDRAEQVLGFNVEQTERKYNSTAATTNTNETERLEAPEQEDGKIISHASQLNQYGLYDNTVSVDTAKSVEGAELQTTESKFVVDTRIIDRNQTEPLDETFNAREDGKIKTSTSSLNDYGRYDNTKQIREAVFVDVAGSSSVKTSFEEQFNVSSQNADNPEEPSDFTVGTIIDARSQLNDFGKWDTTKNTRTALFVAGARSQVASNKYETVETNEARNQASTTAIDEENGKIKEINNQLNDFGRWDVSQTTRTARVVNESNNLARYSIFETATTIDARNQPEKATASFESGKINEARSQLNDYGLWDTSLSSRAGIGRSDAGEVRRLSVYESAVTTRSRNQGSKPAGLTVAAGEQKESNSELNEFGLWDNQITTRTATAPTLGQNVFPTMVRSESFFVSGETIGERNKSSALANPAVEVGKIKEARSELNEFGRWDTSLSTRTASPNKTTSAYDHGAFLFRTKEQAFYNQSAAQSFATYTRGIARSVNNRLNEFGLYDSVVETRTAQADDTQDFTSGSVLVRQVERNKVNQAVTEKPGVGAAGSITRVTNRINEYGLYDVSLSTSTAVSFDGAQAYKIEENDAQSATLRVYKNKSAVVAALDKQEISASLNEYGLYDYNVVTFTPKEQSTDWISYDDKYGTSHYISFRNKPESYINTVKGAFSAATQNSLSVQKNRFGLIDGSASRVSVNSRAGGGQDDPPENLSYTVQIAGKNYDVDIIYTGNLNAARAHLSGKNNAIGGGLPTPGITAAGQGRWRSTVVTRS